MTCRLKVTRERFPFMAEVPAEKVSCISSGLKHARDCDCDPIRGTPGRSCLGFTREIDAAQKRVEDYRDEKNNTT